MLLKTLSSLLIIISIYAQDSTVNSALNRYQELFNTGLDEVALRIDSLERSNDSLKAVIDSMNAWINEHSVTWYYWEIDSTYLAEDGDPIRDQNGDFLRRNNDSYLYLKQDENGKLIPHSFIRIQ